MLRHEDVNKIWWMQEELSTRFTEMKMFRNVDEECCKPWSEMLYKTEKDFGRRTGPRPETITTLFPCGGCFDDFSLALLLLPLFEVLHRDVLFFSRAHLANRTTTM